MPSLRAREATQPLAGEMLKGRVALVAGGTRRCAGAFSYITGRVWTLNGSREL